MFFFTQTFSIFVLNEKDTRETIKSFNLGNIKLLSLFLINHIIFLIDFNKLHSFELYSSSEIVIVILLFQLVYV